MLVSSIAGALALMGALPALGYVNGQPEFPNGDGCAEDVAFVTGASGTDYSCDEATDGTWYASHPVDSVIYGGGSMAANPGLQTRVCPNDNTKVIATYRGVELDGYGLSDCS